ncbi:MAG: sugar transferase [Bacteroidetes bacterium]|nr:sugar transferase [Bacteroidota bacterium]
MFNIPKHKWLLYLHDFIILLLVDFTVHSFSEVIEKRYLYSQGFIGNHLLGDLIIVGLIYIFFAANRLYRYQVVLNRAQHMVALIKAHYQSFILFVFFTYFLKIIDPYSSRLLVFLMFSTLFVFFTISRVFVVPSVYFWLVKEKIIKRNLIIIGAGDLSQKKVRSLEENRNSYFNIVGYLDNDSAKQGQEFEGHNVIGHIKDLKMVVEQHKVKDILIAINNISAYDLQCIIEFAKNSKRTIHVVSELYSIITEKIEIEEIGGLTAFRIRPASTTIYESIKRIVDLVVSLSFIIVFFPVWLIFISIIKITSPGPILYKARVIGRHEKEFLMFKFRSMYHNASTKLHEEKTKKMISENGTTEKLKNDPRITPIGRFIRKFSIDEFPQLLNVIRGEMSLVGPRPNVPYEFEVMSKWQKKRFQVKPGMTGMWQIKGRDEVRFSDQIALDVYYIENRSLKLDLEILFKTIPVVVFGKGGK